MDLDAALGACPLLAILRGIEPTEIDEVSDTLVAAGFTLIEIPLTAPEPLRSIERLAKRHGEVALIGAGIVMTPEDVIDVRDAGGQLIVTPHCDADTIEEATAEGLTCIAGCATPTEGFEALTAGANALNLFPAQAMPPAIVAAWREIFPAETRLLVTGGVAESNLPQYMAAGAAGAGVATALYAPGRSPAELAERARRLRTLVPATG